MNSAFNPYQAPGSPIEVQDIPRSIEPASKSRRFGTFVVDYAGFLAFGVLIGVVTALAFGDAGVATLERMPDLLLGSTLFFVYYVFFEGLWARTPGKWLFGTVVVNEQGLKPSLGQVLGRTACRFIPFEALSCFGSAAWHDSIPKTRVIRSRKVA